MAEATTTDTLFAGALRLEQPARGAGYRFNVDALLLAREALRVGRVARAADLGAGCGVAGLALRAHGGCDEVLLVERDPWMASLAARNAQAWPGASALACAVEALPARTDCSLVLSNPPYTPPDGGRPCPEPRRAAARRGQVAPFLAAAARLLAPTGRALFIYPASYLTELLAAARACALEPVALRLVHPTPDAPARVVLAELAPRMETMDSHLQMLAPWIERGASESRELERFVRERPRPSTLGADPTHPPPDAAGEGSDGRRLGARRPAEQGGTDYPHSDPPPCGVREGMGEVGAPRRDGGGRRPREGMGEVIG